MIDPKLEKHLVDEAKSDISRFEKLYSLYSGKISKYFKYRVNDEFIADDLTSQTFEKALKSIKQFQWQGIPFSAWIYRIASNTLIDYYRKQSHNSNAPFDHNNLLDKSILPEAAAIELDYGNSIKALIGKLSNRDQQIIIMKFYEGYTNKVIAKRTGLSETNVGTIINRALKKLRGLMLRSPHINI